MRALSIRQPWAWLILHGGKDIENRTWRTGVRGRVLIHAGKGMSRAEYENVAEWLAMEVKNWSVQPASPIELPPFGDLERGGLVGEVEITGCVSYSHSPWFCGPFGFVLSNAKPLPFQPCRGELGFFNCPFESGVKAI